MFCLQCGQSVDIGSAFCSNCGAKVETGQAISTGIRSDKVSSLRHPKEVLYLAVGAIIGGMAWLGLIWVVLLFFWLAVPVLIGLWVIEQLLKTRLLGNAVKVSAKQYPEIYDIVKRSSEEFGVRNSPDVFVINSNGTMNALAVKLLLGKYVILFSALVDTMLEYDSMRELCFVIAHEIGHHAAGHTALWKRLLLWPAMYIPFFGPAYSRACELTADRMGLYVCGDRQAACRGLMALASGSRVLGPKTDLAAFKEQEKLITPLFAFLHDLWVTHPRITKRILEVEEGSGRVIGAKPLHPARTGI